MTHTCEPTDLARNQDAACTVTLTNNSAAPAPVNFSLVVPSRVDISSVSVPATGTSRGFTWNGTLTPALPPTIISVTPGATPAGGYLPLSAFGIAPIAGMGDETIVNYNVPPFTYGTETYTRVGVVSNGYVVIGSGTAQDVDYLNQPIPSTTRPNNIIAPFWTDLNPSAGGAVRVGSLSDGTNDWLVIDYDKVPNWSSAAQQNSFQVWIGLNGTDDVTIANSVVTGGDGGFLSQGAENRDGTSGAAYSGGSNTAWVVNATGPTPGGSVQITYDASSSRAGSYVLAPTATSPLVKGTISVPQTLRVK